MGGATKEIWGKILEGEVVPNGWNPGPVSENVEKRFHACMAKGVEIILEDMSLMKEGFGGVAFVIG